MVVQGSKPNFLEQMSYHIFLPMVLRARGKELIKGVSISTNSLI